MLRWSFPFAGILVLAIGLAACTHERFGPVESHYTAFKADPPAGDTLSICHAYTCRMKTKVRFGKTELAEIGKVMAKVRKDDSPGEERRAVAYAVAWLETYVGNKIGTSADRPGMEFNGTGDPTQQDCVDEATNTTSYLLLLERNGFLKHHRVGTPFAKENPLHGIGGWPHWTAVLWDKGTGQKWAVDSWIYQNGENPAVVEAEKWYIDDLASLPPSTN